MFHALIRSFRCAFSGIGWALRTQRNLRVHTAATLTVVSLGLVVNLSAMKWCAVLGCIALVWVAELLNTALEVLCDRVSREQDESIRRIKDVAAGAVLIAAIISVIVAAMVFL